MASANLLALIDDITTVLDDIAMMTKVAARKTAGVLGDDLALNAQQVTGVRAQRELPVVWAVALGSLKNKAILVPAALLISVIAPWLITPLLMLGGAFLCFEGAEKILHKFLHAKEHEEEHQTISSALQNPEIDFLALEREKIKGAVRTDFILSAEIIVITLGTVATVSFPIQVTVMVGVALLMTVGVYGLVAGIVKLDDAGLWLSQREGDGSGAALQRALGRGVLWVAPWLMKTLSVVGTIAMFLVGGGILVHGIPWLAHLIHGIEERASSIPAVGDILAGLTPMVLNGVLGVVAGLIVVALFSLVQRLRGAKGHD